LEQSPIWFASSCSFTPSPILNLHVSDLSNSLLKKLKPIYFTLPLVCIHLGYLRTDISGIDQASLLHLTHISLSFTVILFTPIFILFDLCMKKRICVHFSLRNSTVYYKNTLSFRGLCHWIPLGAKPPDPHYRLALRARHMPPFQTPGSASVFVDEIWKSDPSFIIMVCCHISRFSYRYEVIRQIILTGNCPFRPIFRGVLGYNTPNFYNYTFHIPRRSSLHQTASLNYCAQKSVHGYRAVALLKNTKNK